MAGQFRGPGPGGPDLEKTLQGLKFMRDRFGGSSKSWIYIAIAAVVVWGLTGIYIVNPDELAVVRRFGAMTGTSSPGIHFRIPWPVDEVDTARIAQIRSMELGFRTGQGRSAAFSRPVPVESLMITGDENLVNIQVVIQYSISDLPSYLFKVWDPTGTPEGRTLREAAETALRGVVGSMTIDDILTVGRARVQEQTKTHLQQLMDTYETGLLITEVKLQAVEPPEPVQASFKDVVSAKENRERIINEAKAYAEDILPKARGQAQQMIRAAEGYRESRIRQAEGDTNRFLSMLKEYSLAKTVTRRRLYLETMGEVLAKVDKVVVSERIAEKSLPLLPFSTLGGSAVTNTKREGQ